EEIAMEGKEDFMHAGGAKYEYIPALNDSALLVKALGDLAMRNLQGWLNTPPSATQLEQQVVRAKALGATN
ncbi:MAG: ferrochelatase, partial [Casimicrobium sp.]